ncbi:hypothetical protein ACJOV8_001400 [Formosa sp. 3Alg 14/1]|uniref:hypothetical protein n=1 Tax=Formosa sp. 3Alg 14/1 TaxID=3382190 RepID=UPI0039BE064F
MEYAWSSLDIAKILISVATPVIGGIIAFRLTKIGNDLDNKKWTSQLIMEKRLEFYDLVVPDLNDIYCYFRGFGNWKEFSPIEIIQKKRKLDKSFYIHKHIFNNSGDLTEIYYKTYIHNCFVTGTTKNNNNNKGKIKTDYFSRKSLPNWDDKFEDLFDPANKVEKEVLETSYGALMNFIEKELGI